MTTVYKGKQGFRSGKFYMCERKRPFLSEDEALRRAQQIAAKGGPPMKAYQCPHCNAWHLARKK